MYKVFENSTQKSIDIEADTLELLFKDIAFSLRELIFGNITTSSKSLRNIYIIENSIEELIIEWIGELNRQIVYHDWIFDNFKKIKISSDNNEFSLRSDLTGEGINSDNHKILYDTTYLNIKNLQVEKSSNNKYKVRFDIEI